MDLNNKFIKDIYNYFLHGAFRTWHLRRYQINELKINHYDLFRIKSSIELKNLDLFSDIQNAITVIEWPQIIEKKPKNLIELTFEYKEDHKRRSVQIKGLEL